MSMYYTPCWKGLHHVVMGRRGEESRLNSLSHHAQASLSADHTWCVPSQMPVLAEA